MNRFRKLGFIKYDVGDHLQVHSSLLNVVLHDDDVTTPGSGKLAPRLKKVPAPPARRGGTPDNQRAKRPPIFSIKRRPN
jgi:hypothetical protein